MVVEFVTILTNPEMRLTSGKLWNCGGDLKDNRRRLKCAVQHRQGHHIVLILSSRKRRISLKNQVAVRRVVIKVSGSWFHLRLNGSHIMPGQSQTVQHNYNG